MNNKIIEIKEEIISEINGEDNQKCSLYDILNILHYPEKIGWKDKMEKKVFSSKECKEILNRVWPKIMTEEEWLEMVREIEKLDYEE